MKERRIESSQQRRVTPDERSELTEPSAPLVQRLQQSVGNLATARALRAEDGLAARIRGRLGGGRRLPSDVQQRLEHGLGGSLAQVRVHDDGPADQLSRELSARAFTTGSDIFFRRGGYDPGSPAGLRVLAHEADHTLQQARGHVEGRPVGGLRIGDPGDRLERSAELAARRVLSGEPAPHLTAAARRSAAPIVQRLAEPHTHGCNCSSCAGLVVQRFPAMNDLSLEAWKSESSVWGKKRSEEFRALDGAVEAWSEVRTLGGLIARRIVALEGILAAIEAWRTARAARWTSQWWTASDRSEAVDQLAAAAQDLLRSERARKIEVDRRDERAKQLAAIGGSFDERVAPYVKRTADWTQYENPSEGGGLDLLSRARDHGGRLTDDVVAGFDRIAAEEIDDVITKSAAAGVTNAEDLDTDALRSLHGRHRAGPNIFNFPELANLFEPNDERDENVTETLDLGGVSWDVTYNKSDVHAETKLGAVRRAIARIVARGFRPPRLRLHLPKYGRELSVSSDCVNVGKATERAIFHAPDFLHISSNALGLPILEQATGVRDREAHINKGYKFSSSHFDPSGVATMVHEVGHAMHYANSPERFHGLFMSSFADVNLVGLAAAQVSEYGTKPREFVAEVFLGLVYDRVYADEVMRMYVAFGGPLPPDLWHKYGERQRSIAL